MITLKKLASLKEGTRQRKYVRLLRTYEEDLLSGISVDQVYLRGLLRLMSEDLTLSESFCGEAGMAAIHLWDNRAPLSQELLRVCNDLRHRLLGLLGMEPGDWDLMPPTSHSGIDEKPHKIRKSLAVNLYLDDIRSPFNVGSLFRTSEAMGVKHIYLSPGTASPEHNRAKRSAMGAVEMVPWSVCSLQDLALNQRNMGFFALELGGENPEKFSFPVKDPEGCMILGSEELGVSPGALDLAEKSLGRVSLSMRGLKGSLNVAVAAGIILYHWTSQF
jgi:TrmH family RNA methyltransferase